MKEPDPPHKEATPEQIYAAKYITVLKRQAREWAEKHPELLVKKDPLPEEDKNTDPNQPKNTS